MTSVEIRAVTLCLLLCGICHAVTEIKVGVILISGSGAPYDYERTAPAIDIAVEKVNRELINNATHLLVPLKRTYGPSCDAVQAPGELVLKVFLAISSHVTIYLHKSIPVLKPLTWDKS